MALLRYLLLLFLSFALFTNTARADDASHFQFEGEATGGQDYDHPLANGLSFHLIATSDGWMIAVYEKDHAERDALNLADITPPLHGPNAVDIRGQDFQTPSKAAADSEDEKSATPSPETHEFQFALSAKDHAAVWFDYDCASGSQSETDCDKPHDLPSRLGYATLHIQDYKLGAPPATGQAAALDHMKFTVNGDLEAPRGMDE